MYHLQLLLKKIRIGGLLCSTKQRLKKNAWQHPHLRKFSVFMIHNYVLIEYLKKNACIILLDARTDCACFLFLFFPPFHYAATQPPTITPLFLEGLDPLILLTYLFSVFHLLIFCIICKSHFGCSWYGHKRIQWKHRTRWFIYVSSFHIALIDIQLVQFSSYVGPRSNPGYKNTCLLLLFSLQHSCV